MSENPISADNQQERLFKVTQFDESFRWYLTGFVDGEGSFCISVKKHPDTRFGWQIDPSFYLYQHEKNKWILELVKDFFQGGGIHRKSSPWSVYTYALHGVRNMREKVIPFFQQYPLCVKAETFTLFTQAVELMERKEHLHYEGFKKVLHIAYLLNSMGKGRKWNMDDVLKSIPRDYTLDTTLSGVEKI